MILPDLDKLSEAIISECSQYRYWLHRQWMSGSGWLVFVMLNPSTADAMLDDPTIRRCIGFAKLLHYRGIIVVNLFAGRAGKPEILFGKKDPEGPENSLYLAHAVELVAERGGAIVVAWGANKLAIERSVRMRTWLQRQVGDAYCLGTTDGGHPRHPLYVPGTEPIQRFKWKEAA